MTHDEYTRHDATALSALVRTGEVTPLELIEVAVQRLEAVNPAINAVVYRMDDEARARAEAVDREALFAGVPFLAKDLQSDYAGHPTSRGSRLLVNRVAEADTELVRRVRATGVSVLGKTNTPEFGMLPYTEPELWGPCRNPWSLDRTPGGSSGGSAAAVAAGIVPIAGGGDGAGSIRMPASCCGLFGFKPTRGRTPSGPGRGESWRGAAIEHVLTRSVRDSAVMLDATHGPGADPPYRIEPPAQPFSREVATDPERLRIAWTTEPMLGSTVHPDCVEAIADAVKLLADLGHDVVEAAPMVDGPAFARAFLRMMAGELGAEIEDLTAALGRKPRRSELEPLTWCFGLVSRALSSADFAHALRTLERTGNAVAAFFTDWDVLVTPTLATPPPAIGGLPPRPIEHLQLRVLGAIGSGRVVKMAGLIDRTAADAFDFTPWTPVFNISGQPAMSVPLHWNAHGLPVGVHFVARVGDEATLLRLAGQLERTRPWFDRVPEMDASGLPANGLTRASTTAGTGGGVNE
ncbi:MAG: amidase [Gemmatimonadetes bacterium]|nr:amidase [Gemmatimonadota bacterium]MYK65300.1 amidase [Gemmatimonadota bacterium]